MGTSPFPHPQDVGQFCTSWNVCCPGLFSVRRPIPHSPVFQSYNQVYLLCRRLWWLWSPSSGLVLGPVCRMVWWGPTLTGPSSVMQLAALTVTEHSLILCFTKPRVLFPFVPVCCWPFHLKGFHHDAYRWILWLSYAWAIQYFIVRELAGSATTFLSSGTRITLWSMVSLAKRLTLESAYSDIQSAVFRKIFWSHVDSQVSKIWATTWQNQQNECALSVDSDQPGHPPSLIRVFAVRSVGS